MQRHCACMATTTNGTPDKIICTMIQPELFHHAGSDEVHLFTCFLEVMFIQTHATVYTVHCWSPGTQAQVQSDMVSTLVCMLGGRGYTKLSLYYQCRHL